MRYAYLILAFAVAFTVSIFGFRGQPSIKPPMDVFPEWAFPSMKYQPKYKYQGESGFFADGRADRPLPPGVVVSSYGPAGQPLRSDNHLYRGQDASGAFVAGFPSSLKVDASFMARGKDRFSIYCAPCHGALGDGMGITKVYGMGVTPSYHIDRLRVMTEGELFNTVTKGKNNMLPYADKLSPEDRWAVIAYLRALQRAPLGKLSDLSEAQKQTLPAK
jgi:mono/diheme cytochrome c family protein